MLKDAMHRFFDRVSGEVDIEDWERGTFKPIAPSLEALFEGMKP